MGWDGSSLIESKDEITIILFLTLSQTANSTLPNCEFVDNKFKFDENGSKFSKRIKNTVGKGEIARYEQFLLFPQCFQESCTADT